jgi:hypothetical protein
MILSLLNLLRALPLEVIQLFYQQTFCCGPMVVLLVLLGFLILP